jgi:hypothetical protein
MFSLGREPQVEVQKKLKAAERRQKIEGQWLQLTLQQKSVAPPGLREKIPFVPGADAPG